MELLKNNSYITKIDPLVLTNEVLSTYGPKTQERVAGEYSQINAYSMTYKSQGHTVRGFILEPKEGDNLPCIIMNRGGCKEFGVWTPKMIFNFMGYFAARGYIVIASQFSGCAGSEGKDEFGGSELEDILVLRELLGEYPRANRDRIGMDGASRGGMMTYLAMAKVDWIKAAVVTAGISNLPRNYELRPSLREFIATVLM